MKSAVYYKDFCLGWLKRPDLLGKYHVIPFETKERKRFNLKLKVKCTSGGTYYFVCTTKSNERLLYLMEYISNSRRNE